jgi:endogenous inhibitor of DNA gyrase (YacG/DUF329 family)
MTCPLCQKTSLKPYSPFCSKRCADLDLGKWLRGDYAVPVVEEDDVPDSEEDPAQRTE